MDFYTFDMRFREQYIAKKTNTGDIKLKSILFFLNLLFSSKFYEHRIVIRKEMKDLKKSFHFHILSPYDVQKILKKKAN